jgi:sugar lactone lactonase YvrE
MHILALSFNQPKIWSNATWCENATIFVDNSTIGGPARGFFIDSNDTVFVAAQQKSQILIWSKESIIPVRTISAKLPEYTTLFVAINGDIYFENGNETGRVDKWITNSNDSTFVTKFSDHCYGLFIDTNNTLYCSLLKERRVVKKSLDDKLATQITVAGNYGQGSVSNQLSSPSGIFVNINFDLYVADPESGRIQLFQRGQLNATTVAGNGIPHSLQLNYPTDVVLDANDYLYIADDLHNRVIRSGYGEWKCVIGCSCEQGSAPNELYNSYSIRFDSHGNIYVADEYNNRIQKFTLESNSCGKCDRKLRLNVRYC